MQIKIGEKISKPSITNCYQLSVETMTGDADDYHNIEKTFSKDDKEQMNLLRDCIIVLELISEEECSDFYDGVYKWDECFGYGAWHCDTFGNRDRYKGHWISYYDENGIEYGTEVIWDDEMNVLLEEYKRESN